MKTLNHSTSLGALLIVSAAMITPTETHAQSTMTAPPSHCSAPVNHQFDFFIGDWDTYETTDSTTIVARNHVSPMVNGCAIREVYHQNDGMSGESFSTYDAARHVWHQSWVTSRGELLLLDGRLDGANMVFTAHDVSADGSPLLRRITWSPQQGSVREIAVKSADGGKTWTPMFDIIFRPHR